VPVSQRFLKTLGVLLAALSMISTPALAQWLNIPDGSIPKTKEGKPDMAPPAPRNGKPDLSGTWIGNFQDVQKYITADQVADLAAASKPGEFPAQPWAEALTRTRTAAGIAWPAAHCLPPGIPMLDLGAALQPLKIIQQAGLVVILYEWFGESRQIFMDGVALPATSTPRGWAIHLAVGAAMN
jgi:hypothetical protein